MLRTAVAYLLPQDQLREGVIHGRGVIAHTVVEADVAGRAGLAEALEAIARGQADALLVARLAAAARSLGELMRLLDWLAQHEASLMALDVELDSAARSGQRTLAVLREVHRWTREPEGPRRPPGRPGLSELAPKAARRISFLRQQGLSLHAIAEALNAEGVPTLRGGARWRASSVQSALGYRRPHPPVPGAPRPPRSPSPHGKPPAGPGPRGRPPKPPGGRGRPRLEP
jgi:hypothetical protein